MATHISPLASVDAKAIIAEDVVIGPFCTVGPFVTIGPGTQLGPHVTLLGRVSIGRDNRIHANVVIGDEPQDVSYRGTNTRVEIGDGNIIREGVTINRASEKEDGVTVVGNRNFLMANVHVAHDCKLGNQIVMANGTLLGGHVHVQDHASLSGGVAIHHFASVGRYAFISGLSRVLHDVPPYMLVEGSPARPRCINVVALKRAQFDSASIHAVSEAHKLLFRSKVGLDHAREVLRANGLMTSQVMELLTFVQGTLDGRHGRGRDRRRVAA